MYKSASKPFFDPLFQTECVCVYASICSIECVCVSVSGGDGVVQCAAELVWRMRGREGN